MEYIRTLSKAFDVGDRAALTIDSRSGSVIVRGDETQQVRVEVVARLWAESDEEADEQAELIERGVQQEGERVTIRAPALARTGFLVILTRGPRIDYQVTVPHATKATITSRSGRIEVENVREPLQAELRSGRIAVREIGADVRIVSRSGGVQAESIEGALTIESRSGVVRVSSCAGDVTVLSRSGLVQVEDVARKLKIESRTGAIRYDGDVHASFDISVRTGSVRLAVNPNSGFFLDAEATTGMVRSDLPLRRDAPAPTAGGPTVRIRARTGSIHIRPR